MKKLLTFTLTAMLLLTIYPKAEFLYTNQKSLEDKSQECYELALSYVGLQGDCFKMATKFLREYFDNPYYSINAGKMTQVEYKDLMPGDVIFYSKSSAGTTHWAVYLGNDKAFQGNWGTQGVIIGDIYYGEGWSSPIFYHQNSSNEEKIEISFNFINFME